MDMKHYQTLASMFYFPDEDYRERIVECQQMLSEKYPDVAETFEPFVRFVGDVSPAELEKIYIRTFDIQPLCCLDVGYVLFGEDYKRGKLLANLNKEHEQEGIDCRGELADRLPNVLQLMARSQNSELREELVTYVLKPALEKMVDEFVPARIDQKEELYEKYHQAVLEKKVDRVTKFRIPLEVVRDVLREDFPEAGKVELSHGGDFVESVRTELKNKHQGKWARKS